MQGLLSKTKIAGLHQANCSYSEIYKTLKAEEIPISLSDIKRIGQRFETTGNVARKEKNLEDPKPQHAGMTTC